MNNGKKEAKVSDVGNESLQKMSKKYQKYLKICLFSGMLIKVQDLFLLTLGFSLLVEEIKKCTILYA